MEWTMESIEAMSMTGLEDSRSIPLGRARFGVLDFETTGFLHDTDRVVEAACAIVSLEAGVIHHESHLVNPGRPIPAAATGVHGLKDEDVAQAGSLDDAMAKLGRQPFHVWAAHNSAFDFGFLPAQALPIICTLVLARRLWPDLLEHKNQSLRAHFKLEVPEAEGLPAHRAEPDALVTAALLRLELKEVQERYPELQTLGAFLDWMNTPFLLPYCAIGNRHRGKPWSEVPRDYMEWGLKNFDNLDLDLRATLQHYLGD